MRACVRACVCACVYIGIGSNTVVVVNSEGVNVHHHLKTKTRWSVWGEKKSLILVVQTTANTIYWKVYYSGFAGRLNINPDIHFNELKTYFLYTKSERTFPSTSLTLTRCDLTPGA